MAKVYIANTALILEDEAGKQFRVEAGEAIELTPEQYESGAARRQLQAKSWMHNRQKLKRKRRLNLLQLKSLSLKPKRNAKQRRTRNVLHQRREYAQGYE